MPDFICSGVKGGAGEGEEGRLEVEADTLLSEMMENLDAFVLDPAPQGALVKCRITRDRKGMDRGEYKLAS